MISHRFTLARNCWSAAGTAPSGSRTTRVPRRAPSAVIGAETGVAVAPVAPAPDMPPCICPMPAMPGIPDMSDMSPAEADQICAPEVSTSRTSAPLIASAGASRSSCAVSHRPPGW